ncbi:ERF family protein [Vagococcus sp.]|uniref:ERF family protein n=1 Tax=Vagococcus sp. TaxID=1933889 RepID=UPI000ED57953|nr:ERF family protein [Vagococcus sp.]HCT96512.1 hypothetical protein [Vagococcus sp.]
MKMSDETTSIVKALIKVQSSLEPIKKDKANEFASSKYATLDAILEVVLPILSTNEIFMTQEPKTEIQENGSVYIGVTTTLFHSSGEFFEYETLWFQLEKGAKMNMAQSSGSVITYIKRYSISAVLGISTDEDKDGIQPVSGPPKRNHSQQNFQQQQKNTQPTQSDNQKEIETLIAKYRTYLLENNRDLNELNQYIIKKENVARIEQVDRVRIMGYYKAFTMKQKETNETIAKQPAQESAKQPVQTELDGIRWGQRK